MGSSYQDGSPLFLHTAQQRVFGLPRSSVKRDDHRQDGFGFVLERRHVEFFEGHTLERARPCCVSGDSADKPAQYPAIHRTCPSMFLAS
jgi:hypothetical protein